MKEEYLNILGKMTYGIYVLTTRVDEVINGMIASWVSQVSYDPLLIMAAVHPNRYTHGLITQSGCFALNIISGDQKEYLRRFKGADSKLKFSSIEWENGLTGVPVLKDCIGYLECRVMETLHPGNHALFIGEVTAGQYITDGTPFNTSDYEGVYTGRI